MAAMKDMLIGMTEDARVEMTASKAGEELPPVTYRLTYMNGLTCEVHTALTAYLCMLNGAAVVKVAA